MCLCQNWMRGRGYRSVHVWGHVHEAAVAAEFPEIDWRVVMCHRCLYY